MIRQNEHSILIPKGAGKFYSVLKNKKEIKNDLLSNMAPPHIQSCNKSKLLVILKI